jgi:Meckel syndrome type 1 protein
VVVVPPPYYGGYGGYGYYDDDWMWGMAVGTTMVVGAAVIADEDNDDDETTIINTAPATATGPAALPCDPTVTIVDGVTYYRCGQQHYVLAYGGTGPIYMPVSPPGTPAAPPG